MKRLISTIIALVMIIAGCVLIANGQETQVEITTNDDSISVIEKLTVDTELIDFIDIWQYPSDHIVVINGKDVTLPAMYNLPYSINLTEQNITVADYYEMQYSLNKDTSAFEKTLQYNTTSISITFDGKEIYTGTNLKSGSSLNVALQKEQQGQTITIETIPTWIYIIIAILVIIIVLSLMRPTKKQKSTKKKETITDSKELLSTKKALLMESLKDIEKKHRAKKISDDTYHKLKDKYKQEAIDTMKKLEDMK